jgi:exopolysaccharide biosynthesis WecB/TagA/CpsF family protein
LTLSPCVRMSTDCWTQACETKGTGGVTADPGSPRHLDGHPAGAPQAHQAATELEQLAADIFRDRYPGLEIAGMTCPPVGFENDEQELGSVQRQVTEAAPRIVLVALGFPKQDLLIRLLRSSLPHASFLGVGISLSYATGDLSRAPDWTCRLGLEWAYRLSQEPTRRLARRYLVDGLPFALRLMTSAAWHRVRRGTVGASGGWDE